MGTYDLCRQLIRNGILRNPDLIKAFQTIDRADFVPSALSELAYSNEPLPIGYGQTISQPATVAFMLELLDVQEGQRILDIGSGSGFTTALLAAITGKTGRVIGVEAVPQLVHVGNENLAKYPYRNAEILPAPKELGYAAESPYDRILVSASAAFIPQEIVDQLKDGGRAVLPVGESVVSLHKTGPHTLKHQEYPGFLFVPLIAPTEVP